MEIFYMYNPFCDPPALTFFLLPGVRSRTTPAILRNGGLYRLAFTGCFTIKDAGLFRPTRLYKADPLFLFVSDNPEEYQDDAGLYINGQRPLYGPIEESMEDHHYAFIHRSDATSLKVNFRLPGSRSHRWMIHGDIHVQIAALTEEEVADYYLETTDGDRVLSH